MFELQKEPTLQEITDSIDTNFLSRSLVGADEKHVIDQVVKTICSSDSNLENEVSKLKYIYSKTNSIQKTLIEARTKSFAIFGSLLVIHRQNCYNTHGKNFSWIKWFQSNFPEISDTKRRQAETIGFWSSRFTNFYFLGVEDLYIFIQATTQAAENNIKISSSVYNKLGLNSRQIAESRQEKSEQKVKIKKFISYLKASLNFKHFNQLHEICLDAIITGLTFNKNTILELNALKQNEAEEQLKYYILTGTTSPSKKTDYDFSLSLENLLSQVLTNILNHNNKENLLNGNTIDLIKNTISELTNLVEKLDKKNV